MFLSFVETDLRICTIGDLPFERSCIPELYSIFKTAISDLPDLRPRGVVCRKIASHVCGESELMISEECIQESLADFLVFGLSEIGRYRRPRANGVVIFLLRRECRGKC